MFVESIGVKIQCSVYYIFISFLAE